MFKNYAETRDWLESFIPLVYGKEELGLARITELLNRLGNPQNKFKSIHIGGTAGKGSTAFYTARLLEFAGPVSRFLPTSARSNPKTNGKREENLELRAGGDPSTTATRKFKVGLHVSPHLSYIGERMQINGRAIGERRLRRLIGEIKPVVEAIQKEKPELTPSYFEILVAASFLYFAQEKVDWAVIEVGLGGRLDATNVLMPEVAVITNVGLDHTEILGDTVEKIAWEKAGIIKARVSKVSKVSSVSSVSRARTGVPVVTAAKGAALEVIRKVAKDKGASLFIVDSRSTMDYSPKYCTSETAQLAIAAAKTALGEKRLPRFPRVAGSLAMTDKVIEEAFGVGFPGRFEEIEKGVILDGAHNPDKMKVLIEFLISNFRFSTEKSSFPISNKVERGTDSGRARMTEVTLVLAFKKGKNWKTMMDLILRKFQAPNSKFQIKEVIATEFQAVTDMGPPPHKATEGEQQFAAVPSAEIAAYVKAKSRRQGFGGQAKVKVESFENSQEAVFNAIGYSLFAISSRKKSKSEKPKAKSVVLVTGSLYLIGEVREMWKAY